MQGYDVVLFIVALAKTVTPRGSPRREPGQAVAPATKPPLIYPVVAPRKANDIYRPVINRACYFNSNLATMLYSKCIFSNSISGSDVFVPDMFEVPRITIFETEPGEPASGR
jgi:hypothetical protein